MWLNRFKGYALLLGTLEPLRIDVARLEAHFRIPAIQRDLAEVHVATPWQLLESFTMRPETLAALHRGQRARSTPTTTRTWSSTASPGTTPSRRTSPSWRALPTTSRRSSTFSGASAEAERARP